VCGDFLIAVFFVDFAMLILFIAKIVSLTLVILVGNIKISFTKNYKRKYE